MIQPTGILMTTVQHFKKKANKYALFSQESMTFVL